MVKEGYQKTSDTIKARHRAVNTLITLHKEEYSKLYEEEKKRLYSAQPQPIPQVSP